MSGRSTRVWFALFVLAVFSAGAAAGLLGARFVHLPGMRGPGGPPGPGGGPLAPRPVVERLAEQLKLTPAQHEQFRGLLDARRVKLDAMREDVRDRFEQQQRELRDEIRQMLTPEQQRTFDEWVKQQPPPPPDGPEGRGRGPRPEPPPRD